MLCNVLLYGGQPLLAVGQLDVSHMDHAFQAGYRLFHLTRVHGLFYHLHPNRRKILPHVVRPRHPRFPCPERGPV